MQKILYKISGIVSDKVKKILVCDCCNLDKNIQFYKHWSLDIDAFTCSTCIKQVLSNLQGQTRVQSVVECIDAMD